MSWNYQWRPYVPVAERRAKAAREVARMAKRGKQAAPVVLQGRTIASSFWGKAWCDNLEAYSDFANRLPRGRTYVRNGSVVDLQISEGKVAALVSGSELYRIAIKIQPLPAKLWSAIKSECAGQIDSLIELLQGRLSSGVMQIVTRRDTGLFPTPQQIDLDCSCPDWADMCKHVAAVLYGVGARLDEQPQLLFLLRGVNPEELISAAATVDATRATGAPTAPALSDQELADVFGIELADSAPASGATPGSPAAPTPAKTNRAAASPAPPRAKLRASAKAKAAASPRAAGKAASAATPPGRPAKKPKSAAKRKAAKAPTDKAK